MFVQSATARRPDSQPLPAAAIQLVYTLSLVTSAMMMLLALWLLVRRVAGQLHSPLGLVTLTAVAVTLAGLASLIRLAWRWTGTYPTAWKSLVFLLWLIPSAAIVVSAISLSISGTGLAKLVFFWSILISVESVWWWFTWLHLPTAIASSTPRSSTATPAPVCDLAEEIDDSDEQIPEGVCQQLTRSWAEDERDTVTGLLRAQFGRNERSLSLHVAFCPPMLRPPKVTVIQLSGPRARIKPADVQPFGIRFDLRLATAGEEVQDLVIHFEAHCGKPQNAGLGGFPSA